MASSTQLRRRALGPRTLRSPTTRQQLKVFLDCDDCYADFLRSEVEFVDYVRDRTEADVHLLVRQARTASGGLEYTLDFTGQAAFTKARTRLRTVTTSSDTDDVIRRQLAASVRVGLVRVLTDEAVPPELQVSVRLGSEEQRPAVAGDRWNNWVFSVRGSASFQGEESSNQRQIGASFSADRITPDWKITLGADLDHEHEEFDLDEDEPVSVDRRERDFNWLVVKSLGEHWSAGAMGEVESSTFDNVELSLAAAPAIEFNVFPYSQHTRRQLRVLYGGRRQPLHLFRGDAVRQDRRDAADARAVGDARTARALGLAAGAHRVVAIPPRSEQEPPRGRRRGVSIRLARGLSVAGELNATRLRDQLSLPLRGATDEEVLLRLRRLESGYDYGFSVSLTYTFGSIFSSIVNPRVSATET